MTVRKSVTGESQVRREKSLSKKMRFVELRAEGKSLRACEEELKISKSTLCLWIRELSTAISKARGIEEEEFFTKLKLAKVERLRTFGTLLERIREEISLRSLSSISEEKLIELMLKVEGKVTELYNEPEISFQEKEKDIYGLDVQVAVKRSIL